MSQVNVRNRKKADGSNNWEYRFEAASVDGKRKQISKSGFKTKKEALEEGTKALAEYNRTGKHFEPSEISVSDYFDYWLKNYCEANVSDNTSGAYSSIINNHLKPRIGMYKLKSVDTDILQTCVNEICMENKFAESYLKNFLKVIKGSFKYATTTAKFITVNPAIDVSLPNNIVRKDEDGESMIILTKEEVERILERFKNKPEQYYAIMIAYYTGLRISEVYGLTWDCVDLEKKTITVNKIIKHFDYENRKNKQLKGIQNKVKNRWFLGECKTKSSYRTIKIGDTLCDALQTLYFDQISNEQTYGDYFTHTYLKDELSRNNKAVKRIIQSEVPLDLPEAHFVCKKECGETMGTEMMKYPSKVINNEMLIDFNFHALRHTHATMLIEAGVPIKAVSERLGHSSTQITWDVYVGITEQLESTAVDVFEKTNALSTT